MDRLRIAARVVARADLQKKLPRALQNFWDTGEGKDEVKTLLEEMRSLSAFEIMNLVRQIPGIEDKDMSAFPVFKQEVQRAIKELRLN